MMDWRQWIWDQLTGYASLIAIVPVDQMYGAGAVEGIPAEKPFVILRFEDHVPELMEGESEAAHSQNLTVWAHDLPGSYARIDTILGLILSALTGQVSEQSAIACVTQGSSGDLADDSYGTITRNASFRLLGGS